MLAGQGEPPPHARQHRRCSSRCALMPCETPSSAALRACVKESRHLTQGDTGAAAALKSRRCALVAGKTPSVQPCMRASRRAITVTPRMATPALQQPQRAASALRRLTKRPALQPRVRASRRAEALLPQKKLHYNQHQHQPLHPHLHSHLCLHHDCTYTITNVYTHT
jgi:hypothetical protein